jgi:AP2 domain/HNH endonuclease
VKITAKEVREAFVYDPLTGDFIWRTHRYKQYIGRKAGCLHKPTGYWFLTLKDVKIKGHIAAWMYVRGVAPKGDIDHKDLDKANNRIKNLRPSNKSNNGANRPPQKNNTSGYKGVFWKKDSKFWLAQIRARNKLHYIGIYKDREEAARAYDAAALKLFGSHARLNFGEVQ